MLFQFANLGLGQPEFGKDFMRMLAQQRRRPIGFGGLAVQLDARTCDLDVAANARCIRERAKDAAVRDLRIRERLDNV